MAGPRGTRAGVANLQTARARAQEEDWVDEAETEIETPGAKLTSPPPPSY